MFPAFVCNRGIDCHAEFKMAADKDIDRRDADISAKKFRDFAEECRRIARNMPENDRVALIEIADAWIVCAEEAERAAEPDRD